ncbi:hypothetical protein MYX78_03220 [Acidobacteria bacterium AH-259-G07]|nr:hypothetical protein [Acidobacteria bacterium AH-259-G07]
MKRLKSFGFTSLVVLALSTSLTTGTSVRIVNLFEMVQLADRVFWGKCLSAVKKSEESTLLPVMEYVFEVRRGIKGVRTGERVVFRQVQAAQRGVVGIPGIPHYRKGQEIWLFLHGDSRLGLTSPVGLAQGSFRLERTREGDIGFINALENRNLGYRLSVEEARDSGVTSGELMQIELKQPIPIEIFTSLIEKVKRYHSIRGKSVR